MKGKSVYLVALIAIILVAIVLIVEKPFDNRTESTGTPDSLEGIKRVPVFDNVTAEDCNRIEIYQMDGRTSTTITRLNDTWYTNPVRKYNADKKKIDRIFETLVKAEEGEVVSRNPQNHMKFQVDKVTGTRVRFFAGGEDLLEDVYVGKMGMNYMSPSTYVRKEGSDEVLLVNGYMMSLFQAGDENWRERTIFDLEPEKITGFTLRQPGEPPIKLARLASDEWTCLSPKNLQIKKELGTRMLNTFARLRASEFIEDYPQKPYDEYGLGKDAYTFSASLKDYSSTPTLYIGKESEKRRTQWYVRAEGQETVHLIYKYNKDNLQKTLADIIPTPTPTPAPEKSPGEDLMEKVRKETEKKAEELEKMTEEEKNEAAREKLDEILGSARETPGKDKTTIEKEDKTPEPQKE